MFRACDSIAGVAARRISAGLPRDIYCPAVMPERVMSLAAPEQVAVRSAPLPCRSLIRSALDSAGQCPAQILGLVPLGIPGRTRDPVPAVIKAVAHSVVGLRGNALVQVAVQLAKLVVDRGPGRPVYLPAAAPAVGTETETDRAHPRSRDGSKLTLSWFCPRLAMAPSGGIVIPVAPHLAPGLPRRRGRGSANLTEPLVNYGFFGRWS